ncbi:MAG: GDP-mannose 4,6-dehydratase [Coleofasciculus chthonoplastes F3-SA18-01]|uniref:NAD-dependent epimerase/dehydratase family protein n=1 Tax=Coleofasciculus chthonoplastes TaxID=64178 RepID=UPI0032F518C1
MTKALITGGGGFCGRHLIPYLERQGIEIHTLGTQPASKHHYNLTDTADVSALAKTIKAVQPNYVFHLAGVASSSNPTLFYQVNTVYAATLLHALEITGYEDCPVLLVGTSAEYGLVSPEQVPIHEQTPTCPYSHYGISKLSQTLMGLALSRQGRPLVMVRPFNIIGAGMPDYLSIQSFVKQITAIAQGQHPSIINVGNLSSSRDFIDIQEVIKIYWQLIRTPTAYGQVINVCSGQGILMSDLLHKLIEIANIDVDIQTDPARFKPVDVPVHYGSIEKLQMLLGYAPKTNLETVIHSIFSESNAHH